MHETPRIGRARRLLYVGAVAIGLTVGAAGVAAAVTNHGSASDRDTETADGREDNDAEQAEEQAYTDANRSNVAVSQTDAEAAAQAAKPGRVFDTHLQNEDGQLTWEVKIDDGSTVWEIQVDPSSGRVVALETDD